MAVLPQEEGVVVVVVDSLSLVASVACRIGVSEGRLASRYGQGRTRPLPASVHAIPHPTSSYPSNGRIARSEQAVQLTGTSH